MELLYTQQIISWERPLHKYKFVALLLLSILLLQGCAASVVTGAVIAGSSTTDRRTTGTIIDDQGIEFKTSYALFSNKEIYDQSHINVTSYNGLVLLTGETPTEGLKQQVEAEINAIPKVRHIFNELIIAAPSALTSRSSDTWITSKIKTKLIAKESVNPLNIKVVTERGIVYLMGIISRAEAEQAIMVVTQSAGVQRVVKLFEYTD